MLKKPSKNLRRFEITVKVEDENDTYKDIQVFIVPAPTKKEALEKLQNQFGMFALHQGWKRGYRVIGDVEICKLKCKLFNNL